MFKFLSKLFKKPPAAAAQPRLTLPSHTGPVSTRKPLEGTGTGKATPATTPKAKEAWSKTTARRINPTASPEEICGITPGMDREQISSQLAMLYRRHNRAASSLEADLREEAEIMLDVIATMRLKYLK